MSGAHIAAFTKAIQRIDPSKSRREVFTDFCELTYCAPAKVALRLTMLSLCGAATMAMVASDKPCAAANRSPGEDMPTSHRLR
jgi:hypothetical protein